MSIQLDVFWPGNDIGFLETVYNAVAMLSSQDTLIWSVALLASTWALFAGSISMSLGGGSAARSGPQRTALNAFVPLLLALFMTSSDLESTVHIKSGTTGSSVFVDHVPLVVTAVPSFVSIVAHEAQDLVSTAFQGTNKDYPTISASANGFINPLKVLLTARSAMSKMSTTDSDLRSIVSACLSTSNGADLNAVIAAVNGAAVNPTAGSSGAAASQTLPINGVDGTALGALLYQASLATNSYVLDIKKRRASGSLTPDSMLNCPDAVNEVIDRIESALNSSEFSRVILGSTNSIGDAISNKKFTVDDLESSYQAIRSVSTGQTQANAEMINMLFHELINLNLDCLKAEGPNKTVCMASALQQTELERANLMAAASVTPSLKYMGAFANYMLALVIALSPVILLLAMFAGANIAATLKSTVQFLAWPMLIMFIGAEVVNGMIYARLESFWSGLAQGGWLTHNLVMEAYKELSNQIGVASHIMASLPVMMGMLFALNTTSAMTSAAQHMSPKDQGTADSLAPKTTSSSALLQTSAPFHSKQGDGFATVMGTGAIASVASSATYGRIVNTLSSNVQSSTQRQKSIQEGETTLSNWEEAFSKNDEKRVGMSRATFERVAENYAKTLGINKDKGTSQSTSNSSNTANTESRESGYNSQVGLRGSLSAKAGTGGGGLSAGVDLSGGVQRSANSRDVLSSGAENRSGASADAHTKAQRNEALTKALEHASTSSTDTSSSKSEGNTLRRLASQQRQYGETLSATHSNSDHQTQNRDLSNEMVAMSTQIGEMELMNAAKNNQFFRTVQSSAQAADFDSRSAAVQEQVKNQMGADAIRASEGNPAQLRAVTRHAAALRMMSSGETSETDRQVAFGYLLNSSRALVNQPPLELPKEVLNFNLADPSNKSGVGDVKQKVEGSFSKRGGTATGEPINTKPKNAAAPKKTMKAPSAVEQTFANVGGDLEARANQIEREAESQIADGKRKSSRIVNTDLLPTLGGVKNRRVNEDEFK